MAHVLGSGAGDNSNIWVMLVAAWTAILWSKTRWSKVIRKMAIAPQFNWGKLVGGLSLKSFELLKIGFIIEIGGDLATKLSFYSYLY